MQDSVPKHKKITIPTNEITTLIIISHPTLLLFLAISIKINLKKVNKLEAKGKKKQDKLKTKNQKPQTTKNQKLKSKN